MLAVIKLGKIEHMLTVQGDLICYSPTWKEEKSPSALEGDLKKNWELRAKDR